MAANLSQNIEFIAVILLLGLAVAVSQIRQRGNAHRLLAAFLVLVGLGFAAEYVWFVAREVGQTAVVGPARVVQDLMGLADPVLLLGFALANWLPVRRPGSTINPLLLALPIVVVTGVWAFGQAPWDYYAIQVYVNGAYLAAFVLVLDAYVAEEGPYLDRQLRFIGWGIGFVALTRLSSFVWWTEGTPWLFPTVMLAASCGTLGLILLGHAFWRQSFRLGASHVAVPLLVSLLLFMLALFAFWDPASGLFTITGRFPRLYFSQRWLFFAFIAGYGILRNHFFPTPWLHHATALLVAAPVGVMLGMIIGSGWPPGVTRYQVSWLATLSFIPLYLAIDKALTVLLPGARIGLRQTRLALIQAELNGQARALGTLSPRQARFMETIQRVCAKEPEGPDK